MSLECKIYQRELRVLGYGLPLYEPNPAEYDRVRVGDVGIAHKNGYFRRIFNSLPQLDTSDDDINSTYGLPEGFEPLPEACRFTTTSNEISAGSWIRSDHVKQIEGDVDFSLTAASAGARVNFIVSNRQAAALRIKYSAERIDASRLGLYRAYMLKHYKSWARFIRDLGFEFDLRDMILVTGHDLTANWATATLIERASQGSVTMQAGDSIVLGAAASISGMTESSIRVPIRVGPNPYTPLRRANQVYTDLFPSDPVKDQCIFLRGFRVSEKLFVPRIMKAAAGPDELDSDGDSDAHSGVVSVGFDSDEEPQVEEGFVDHNFVLNAILRGGADIAIVHETDICILAKATGNSTEGLESVTNFHDRGMEMVVEFDECLQARVGTVRSLVDEELYQLQPASVGPSPMSTLVGSDWESDLDEDSIPEDCKVPAPSTDVQFPAMPSIEEASPYEAPYDDPWNHACDWVINGIGADVSRQSTQTSTKTSRSTASSATLVSTTASSWTKSDVDKEVPTQFARPQASVPARPYTKMGNERVGSYGRHRMTKNSRVSPDNNPDNLREVIKVLHSCIVGLREENQRLRDELRASRSA